MVLFIAISIKSVWTALWETKLVVSSFEIGCYRDEQLGRMLLMRHALRALLMADDRYGEAQRGLSPF